MTCIVTFGEVMARLAPAGQLLLRQALPGALEVTFAGAEANVAASLATLGAEARFVTALPRSPIADACVGTLRGMGIDCAHIVRSEQGRLGLYFVEHGANQRPSRVIYDRDHSTISLTPGDAYDWPAALEGAGWLHVTGITPAVSQLAAEATQQAVQAAKEIGAMVSCDLNFRAKLWRWDPSTAPRDLAGRVMREILPLVDVLIANEEDCKDVLGISLGATDLAAGALDVARYPDVAREVLRQFPNLQFVATTLRESISASHNNWGAMLYDADNDTAHFAPRQEERYTPYEIRNIVDRIGGGDAFAAGLIYATLSDDYPTPRDALDFAVAASCLCHSILGDFNFSTREQIDALMQGARSGRVVR
jgi:2-dehydro-3-deoxygluconokinase